MKELDLPAPADALIAGVYQRLPTIVQRRIVLRAAQRLSPEEQIEFDKLLKNGDGEFKNFYPSEFLISKISSKRNFKNSKKRPWKP